MLSGIQGAFGFSKHGQVFGVIPGHKTCLLIFLGWCTNYTWNIWSRSKMLHILKTKRDQASEKSTVKIKSVDAPNSMFTALKTLTRNTWSKDSWLTLHFLEKILTNIIVMTMTCTVRTMPGGYQMTMIWPTYDQDLIRYSWSKLWVWLYSNDLQKSRALREELEKNHMCFYKKIKYTNPAYTLSSVVMSGHI